MRNVCLLFAVCVVLCVSCQNDKPVKEDVFNVTFGDIRCVAAQESATVATSRPVVVLNDEMLTIEESDIALLWRETEGGSEAVVNDFTTEGDEIVFELSALTPGTSYVVRVQYDGGERGLFQSDEVSFTTDAATPNPGPDPNPDATELPYLSGLYFGNYYGATDADYNYAIVLATQPNCYDIVSGDIYILENSQYLFIDLYSDAPAEEYNIRFSVPEGVYTLDTTDSAVAGTIGAGYTSMYITNETTGSEIFFVSGTVVVESESIYVELVSEMGDEYYFTCPMTSVDNSQHFGPSYYPPEQSTLEGDLEIAFTNATIATEFYGDYYVIGKNSWLLYVKDEDTGDCIFFDLLAPLDMSFPTGVFPVSKDLNTLQMVLPGYAAAQEAMWSWYNLYTESLTITESAPISDGQISITENNDGTLTVDIDVLDDMGNKISGSCTGNYIDLASRSICKIRK